jgi:hypothetical protein
MGALVSQHVEVVGRGGGDWPGSGRDLFFLAGLSYSSQPTTSEYGGSLLWKSLWCLLAASVEIISSFGLIDLTRTVLNIESILLEKDKQP